MSVPVVPAALRARACRAESVTADAAPAGRLFTSARERRLWAWTFAVVVGIYSTLGSARTLAAVLRDRGLLDASFAAGVVMVAGTIVILGLKARPRGAKVGVVLGVVAVYLLVFLRMAIPEERTHLIEYGVVAAFVFEALAERSARGRRVPAPALLAVVATGLIGVLDEGIQAVLPARVFDPVDMLFNVLAGALAVVALVALKGARSESPRQ